MTAEHARPFISIRPWLRAGLLRHLSPTASRVLFLLVDHAGTDGYSYPSAHLLSRESGHSRKTIYGALQELLSISCIRREGRTRFNSGHRHPGPVYYSILPLDDQAAKRLRRLESERAIRDNATRFTRRKILLGQEHLNGQRCSCGRPEDVPVSALKDVPADGREDIPEPGTYRALLPELTTRALSENPPLPPPTGGNRATGGPDSADAPSPGSDTGNRNDGQPDASARSASPSETGAVQSAGSGGNDKNNGKGKTARITERMRESIRLLLEGEVKLGEGLKPLGYWEGWFPRQYDRTMLREVYMDLLDRVQAGTERGKMAEDDP